MTKWIRTGEMPFFVDGTGDSENQVPPDTVMKTVVLEVIDFDPTDAFHPEIQWHEAPDDITPNSVLKEDGTWEIAPVIVPVVPARAWTSEEVRSSLSLAEKVKWDNDTAPEIVTVKNELPQTADGVAELIDLLVEAGVISQASADKILA